MSSTHVDLTGLSSARLLQLGGLKDRCSASLRCVAHGLALPCDLCELEGDTTAKVVCDACGHLFSQGAPLAMPRACESMAAFASKGKVAFPDVASEALSRLEDDRRQAEEAEQAERQATEARRREDERRTQERRRQREAERRAAEEEARLAQAREEEQRAAARAVEQARREEAEARAREEAERAAEEERRRLFAERLERERLEAEAEAVAERAKRRSSRWWSTAAIAAIAVTAWNLPFLQEGRFRNWFPDGAGEQKAAAAAPSATSPVVPPRTSATAVQPAPTNQAPTPTPVFGGYVTDNFNVLSADDSAYLSGRLERLAGSGIKARLVIVETTGSEALQDFGTRVGNTWNAAGEASRSDLLISAASKDRTIRIDLTKTLNNQLANQEVKALIDGHFQPVAARAGLQQGLRALADHLERVLWAKAHATRGEAEARDSTNNAIGDMLNVISNWDGRATPFAPAGQAVWDSSIARLESLPRPARGDRKSARQLHAQGLALVGQTGLESLAIEKLTLAHQADPFDVQVVNDLAYAQLAAGQHREAVANLRKTFRLAPTRVSAWVNLAEALPFIVKSPDEARQVATLCYVMGYYLSNDRAKTTEYLRSKIDAADTKAEVRALAREALQRIEGFVQADTAGAEAQSAATALVARTVPPAQVASRESSSNVQGQISQAEAALQRRDFDEARRLARAALALDRSNESARALLKRVDDGDLDSLRNATVIR